MRSEECLDRSVYRSDFCILKNEFRSSFRLLHSNQKTPINFPNLCSNGSPQRGNGHFDPMSKGRLGNTNYSRADIAPALKNIIDFEPVLLRA